MKNIQYINAGAGSGKTTTLTKILSEKLGNGGYKPSEVILTTFTELAASEFREKARERLYSDNHADVAAELDSATIGTVHSVALNFIKKYWYLIGVSPDMKVMSEDDLQVYISESLGDYVSSDDLKFFRSYGSFFDLRDSQAHADLDYWKGHLLAIIEKINSYNVDIERSNVDSCKVVEHIFNSQAILNQELLCKFTAALSSQIGSYKEDPKGKVQPILDGLNSKVVTYATIVKVYNLLTSDNHDISTDNRGDLKEIIGDADYDAIVENLKVYQMSSIGDDSPGGMIKKMINLLFSIAKRWQDGFNDFKVRRHIIDYNDMERLFLKLLDQPQVEEEIKGTYKLMMVDEFQDSSPIQLEIFKRLSDLMEQSYWVGDPKQSIYGFRGADVELVNETTQQFYDEGQDPAHHLTHDELSQSWRTREPLVNLTSTCFTRAFKGIIDSENVVLKPTRKESEQFSAPLSHWNCYASRRSGKIFTEKVAVRIKQLLDSNTLVQNKDDKEFRRIKPGDIAILCLKNKNCKAMAKALIKKGIPVSFVNDEILQQTEVQLVFALLKFMVDASNKHVRADLLRLLEDVPTQDILQQRLDYMIRLNSQQENAADKAEKPKDQWLDDDSPLISRLKEFKQMVRNLSVSDLLESIVYGLALPEVVAKWEDADNRRQNLHTLCALAKNYDEHCLQMGIGASVGGLLTYFSYVKIDNKVDNAANAVKVLTYHKSKGLEWPYVILSSLEDDSLEVKSFTKKNFWGIHELCQQGSDGSTSYTIQLLPRITSAWNTNLPQPVIDMCRTCPTYRRLVEKEKNDLRNLLYVGVTRARDYLTTLSLQGGKNNLPTLAWIRNTGISDGEITNNANHLWGEDNLSLQFENLPEINSEEVADEATTPTKYTRYEYPPNPEIIREPKYLSPSKLPVMEFAPENIEILEDFNCRIEPYNTKKETEAAAGTCIHNIFAVYDPRLSHAENVEKATLIRNGNDMYEVIPDVDKVITSIEQLYAWLKTTYGEASSVKHEVPFLHPLPGQMVHGEIDLLWCLNDKECVLIDFKNFPGSKAAITNPDNEHYAGLYASQLKAYRDVLQASGLTVKDTLIYYSVMGCVVRLDFQQSFELI